MGTILTVELANGKVSRETVDPCLEEKFIGGWGIGSILAVDLIRPGIDSFSPENPVIIGTGALVGTSVPSASQVFAITKSAVHASPDRRTIICCGSGGSVDFGRNLRQAGCDILIITGKAKSPSYLLIDNDIVQVCDAAHLWHKKDLYETADLLANDHPGSGSITIGAAGENGVRYALSLIDKVGTLGRAGVGAVLGSKNIKAIVARGTRKVAVADQDRLDRAVKRLRREKIDRAAVHAVHQLAGHASWTRWLKAFSAGVWRREKWDSLYGVEKFTSVKGKTRTCDKCFLGCKTGIMVRDGAFSGTDVHAGYYICVAALAQRMELEDHREAVKLLDICNRAGLCFFTAANTADFVTRLFKAGTITEQQTGGLTLRRDFETYQALIRMIINRQGLGDTLAEGWYALSDRCGCDAVSDHPWVGIAKGFDTIVDARFWGLDSTTFAYFVNPRGHHGIVHSLQYGGNPVFEPAVLMEDLRNTGATEETVKRIFAPVPYYGRFNAARMTRHVEDRGAIIQALGLCDNLSAGAFFSMDMLADCYSAVTGIDTSPAELKTGGERIHNLFKLLNVREGFSRIDDTVPAWITPIAAPDGKAVMKDYYGDRALSEEDINRLLDDYYDERGWDRHKGIPTLEKLAQLGIEACSSEALHPVDPSSST